MNRFTLICAALVFLLAGSVSAQDVLFRNATVLTITDGDLENTDVLVSGGIITEIGSNIRAPRGITEVDATGKYLMPGIIDAHSHIALSSVNEGSSPVTAEVSMEDVVNPYHLGIYRALAGGVTTSHTMHGSANVIGGQNETIKHRFGTKDPDVVRFEGAPRTIKFALGENPTRVHGNRGSGGTGAIVPATRMGVEQVLRGSFENGKRYMEAWDAYTAEAVTNPRAVPPAYNNRLEVMADILRGDVLVHCHSYRADEILMLTRVLNDYGVRKITFQHANEAFKVAPELAAYGAYASVFADWWSYKFEVYYSTSYNAAILMRNGVVTSINSDSGELNRHLYHEAAKSQRYGGLTDAEALSMITIYPAIQLGIQDRVGSIEIGKDGDLALFDGHPLSVYAIPAMTFVDGIKYFDRFEDADDMRLQISPTAEIGAFEGQITGRDHIHDETEVLDFFELFGEDILTTIDSQ
ncbi:MAG: amidohydrolase family protein [Bacteroidetes Order II. Incertae sedis bacterium]|jgi:imidazolonepropionase-like amidohydrolase|nr:amidohydrolase family protein [Bacteroidetes Order II. bacterium]MBT4603579.1 amidohydrolase family protein [Bacteroidetes Order II. bacterium]MBT5250779.1 amidohydrolase family protein [Bacteroidetes Order II. bacterium]MBT6199080.1 amidohydrolase family protein [Bacteroidetes Order II. bacterium]MBT6425894.1 amidohydrolase family protein [Bacteroidetes Order II. bacterium]